MPFTPAQKRLFFAKANRGEMPMKEAHRLAREPTRHMSDGGDVDPHAVDLYKRAMERSKPRSMAHGGMATCPNCGHHYAFGGEVDEGEGQHPRGSGTDFPHGMSNEEHGFDADTGFEEPEDHFDGEDEEEQRILQRRAHFAKMIRRGR